MKNNIYVGVIFLLMTLSNSVLTEEHGISDRVTTLEEEVLELQNEVVGSALEDRIATLEETHDEMKNWSIFPAAYKVAYNDGRYIGQVLQDYPNSSQYYLKYDFNGEEIYAPVDIYHFVNALETPLFFDSECFEIGMREDSYNDTKKLLPTDSLWVLGKRYNFSSGYLGDEDDEDDDYYFWKVDETPISLATYYSWTIVGDTAICRSLSPREEITAYLITDLIYWGPSQNLEFEYIDELPEVDVPHY